MKRLLVPFISEAIEHYRWATEEFPGYFGDINNYFPIVWFGDLETEGPIILSFGANPSDRELIDFAGKQTKRPRFPKAKATLCDGTANSFQLASDLADDYNAYFINNPYFWFKKYLALPNIYKSDASDVHLDALPFATSTKYTMLNHSEPSAIAGGHYKTFDDVLKWGEDFLTRLMDTILKHKTVVGINVVGKSNWNLFKELFQVENIRCHTIGLPGRLSRKIVFKANVQIASSSLVVFGTDVYLPNEHGLSNDMLPLIANALNTIQ